MMNRVSRWVGVVGIVGAAGLLASCADAPDPVGPDDVELNAAISQQVADLENQIDDLFPAPGLRNAAMQHVRNMARDVDRGNTDDAEAKLFDFLDFAMARHDGDQLLDPNGSAPPTTDEAFAELLADLFALVGLQAPNLDPATLGPDGAAEIVDQSGGLVLTETEFAGVDIPAGTFSGPTLVTIARLPDPVVPTTGPLPTAFDQYPLFYDISASQSPQGPVTVGVCVLENPPEPLGAPSAIFPQLRLAHPDPQNPQVIEVLPLAAVPFLDCTNAVAGPAPNAVPSGTGGIGTALLDVGKALWEPLSSVLGARDLHANISSAAMRGRGLGGLATSFSPFGAVDPLSATSSLTSIGGGAHFSCGRRIDGQAFCWGEGQQGQLGNGSNAPSSTPVPVSGGLTFTHVEVGDIVACGITGTGAAYCWGNNLRGQIGAGANVPVGSSTNVPVPVAGSHSFTSLDIGLATTCGIATDGFTYCWGQNSNGELGNGTAGATSNVPVAVTNSSTLGFQSVSPGFVSVCALTGAGSAYCWGLDRGTFGNGPAFTVHTTPIPAASGMPFTSLESGSGYTCGLDSGGLASCWGDFNNAGQLGIGSTSQVFTPTAVQGGLGFTPGRLDPSDNNTFLGHTCAITPGGDMYCWGSNRNGQLGATGPDTCNFSGIGNFNCAQSPIMVSGGPSFSLVAVGLEHTCGVAIDGRAFCWGENLHGELGDGTTTNSQTPVRVLIP